MIDSYAYVIIALLPLTALMLVLQENPYHALVMRAILGAVAALVYAVLGAADVALTEALVGTMLAITLYVVAVRSSLVMRLGVVKAPRETEPEFEALISRLRDSLNQYYLRLELVNYSTPQALEEALMMQAVHGICTDSKAVAHVGDRSERWLIIVRVRRLLEILQTDFSQPNLPESRITYVGITEGEKKPS